VGEWWGLRGGADLSLQHLEWQPLLLLGKALSELKCFEEWKSIWEMFTKDDMALFYSLISCFGTRVSYFITRELSHKEGFHAYILRGL
jgi:hypothetical protein